MTALDAITTASDRAMLATAVAGWALGALSVLAVWAVTAWRDVAREERLRDELARRP